MDDLFGIAKIVDQFIALKEKVVEISENCPEVLACGDRTPAADGVKTNGDGAFLEKRKPEFKGE